MTKTCKSCSIAKSYEDFYRQPANRDGRQGTCKSCMNLRVKAWDKANPDKRRELDKAKYEKRKKNGFRQRSTKRDKLLNKLGGDKCRRCQFVPEAVCQLTIDHIDRNHKNNELSNLQVLCANCHYLKTKVELNSPDKLRSMNLVPQV